MQSKGVDPMPATSNAAVCALARLGDLPGALSLLGVLAAKGVERGVTTYAALLAACEALGRCARAGARGGAQRGGCCRAPGRSVWGLRGVGLQRARQVRACAKALARGETWGADPARGRGRGPHQSSFPPSRMPPCPPPTNYPHPHHPHA